MSACYQQQPSSVQGLPIAMDLLTGLPWQGLRTSRWAGRMDDRRDNLEADLILKVIAGSRSFGLTTDESDEDIRGVFVAPAQSRSMGSRAVLCARSLPDDRPCRADADSGATE